MGSQKKLTDFVTEQNRKIAAGPGDYTLDVSTKIVKQSAPSFGFGSSNRPDYSNKNSPGPGAYKLPRAISNLPSHAMSNPKERFV